jgi:membrane-bound serine protease (ClpP class)
MKTYLSRIFLLLFIFQSYLLTASPSKRDKVWDKNHKILIYKFDINKEIGPAVWRITQQSFQEAETLKADLIIIHMNTYGGLLDAADSIRTIILNSAIPVYMYIDNNAASAGALISIAADRIYMRNGTSIGAATVVNQNGEPLPEKIQSFMRSKMRATAEAHGFNTIIKGRDTIIKWYRDPLIAEAMVGSPRRIVNVVDSGKVLSFTTEEAIKNGYCEGTAHSVHEVIEKAGITQYELKEYKLTTLEQIIGFLVNPMVRGFLIMLIVAGIYFELQTPGVTFPILLAIGAAVLYFAPLYLNGFAQHWEIIVFIIGVILIALEIFVIPGFGITGITGIALVVLGLTFAMIDNSIFELGFSKAFTEVFRSLLLVLISISLSLFLSIYFSGKVITNSRIEGLSLKSEQTRDQGFISVDDNTSLIGKEGIALTMLRPSGKIEVDNEVLDALSEIGYINQGERIVINKCESGQVYVSPKTS